MLWSDRRDAAVAEEPRQALRDLHRLWPFLVMAAALALAVILV